MGYVDKKSPILIGLGPTSISDSSMSFVQNIKDVKAYQQKVMSGALPIEIGHTHNEKDLLIQEVVLEMMCHNEIEVSNKENLPYWAEIEAELKAFQEDGILELVNNRISITPIGKGFVRNIAMSFDYHLREQATKVKFSQTI
jgi:oxygen-independent coproporphyrinogen-3 oxidase